MGNKHYKTCYLFVSIDYKNRLVKISAVSNVIAFRNMMSTRNPTYEIINDVSPFKVKWNTGLHHKIMKILNDCRSGTMGEFRTYKLDNYKVQTVVRLLTNSKQSVVGHDEIMCKTCEEMYEADYSEIDSIYKFVSLDTRYCSEGCKPITKSTINSRYCRCGVIFTPKHNLDFYCQICSKGL